MKFRHKYINFYKKNNFFNQIDNFEDLEKKIISQKTPNKLTKELIDGYALEVFAEIYLNLFEKNIKNVWPQGSVPFEILDKLNLPKKDKGYDGVYEDYNNNFSTYQVKFRTKRSKLTWAMLGTFSGMGEGLKNRTLITNSNNVDSYFKSKKDNKLIRALDFKKLDKNDFLKIFSHLSSIEKIKKSHWKLDNYQIDTSNKVIRELHIKDRTTMILACGLGKTLIGLNIFQKLAPKLSVVFVPSIALVRQTRNEWINKSNTNFRSLVVCSLNDRDLKNDESSFEKGDFNFEITTNIKRIRQWISNNSVSNSVVFCTYQSSKKLCEASKGFKFDFGIYDEAHRTSILNKRLNKKSYFSFALHDANIAIKKRLFMTATRKISKKNSFYKEGDKINALSMDNPDLYGKVCANISFLEGSRLGVIARPKVIISTTKNNTLERHLINKSITSIDGKSIKAQQIANQLALKNIIKKHKIKKIFSFHSSISRSESFTGKGVEGIKNQIPDMNSNHIDGSQNLETRENILHSFKNSNLGIISNVRCLIEGVDVPEVDAVMFTSPKESLIDVIQSVGRSLRKRQNKNKSYGYIILPLYLNTKKNEKISKSLEETKFDLIADVINALREHDDEINQIIEKAIINQKISKGYSGGNDDFDDLIEGYSDFINKNILKKFIRSKILQKLTTKWEEMLSELILYKKKYGNFKVNNNIQRYKDLYEWTNSIRNRKRNGTLPSFKENQLNKINFPWRFDDEEIPLNAYQNYVAPSQFLEKFNIKINISQDHLYIKKVFKSLNLKFYNGYDYVKKQKKLNENKLEKTLMNLKFINIKEFQKKRKAKKIIFEEELEVINKNNEFISLENAIKRFVDLNKTQSLKYIRSKIDDGTLKIQYFVFGSVLREFHAINRFRNEKILTKLIFKENDIKKIVKQIPLIVDEKNEISFSDFNEKYDIRPYGFAKNYKAIILNRRPKGDLGIIKVFNKKNLSDIFKNKLNITTDHKLINKGKFISEDKLNEILINEFSYKKKSLATILHRLSDNKVIVPLARITKKTNKPGRNYQNVYHPDVSNLIKDHFIKKHKKILKKKWDKNKKYIFNRDPIKLKKLGILLDKEVINILKIKAKDPIDLVRNLRKYYNLRSDFYIANEGLFAHGTHKKVVEEFINKYGYYTEKIGQKVSHKQLARIYFFETFKFFQKLRKGEINSQGFGRNKGAGKVSFYFDKKYLINQIIVKYYKNKQSLNYKNLVNKINNI